MNVKTTPPAHTSDRHYGFEKTNPMCRKCWPAQRLRLVFARLRTVYAVHDGVLVGLAKGNSEIRDQDRGSACEVACMTRGDKLFCSDALS